MNISETHAEGLSREYKVVVDADQIESKVAEKLNEYGKTVKIDGFRPGKVPMPVLKQRYGMSVMGDVIDSTVKETSQNLINDKELRLAMPPKIELGEFKDGSALEYTMKVQLFPSIPDMDFSKFTIDRLTFEVDDAKIEEALNRLADHHKEGKPLAKARAVKDGDLVTIDFLGKADGVPFEGGKAEDFKLTIGSNSLIPGFEEQIIGMKKGAEKVITVTFPESYHSDELAGKEATFDINLKEVEESVLPAIDDEFAKKNGFETIDKMKEGVKEQLSKEYEELARVYMKRKLFDALDDKCEFELPPLMIEQEFNAIWNKIEAAKQSNDPIVEGKSDDELKVEYQAVAERRVRLGLLLAEVSSKQNFEVSQEELRQAVFTQAQSYPQEAQQILQYYQQDPQRLNELSGPIIEEKSVDYILEQVKFKDESIALEDLPARVHEEESKPVSADASAKPAKKKAAPKKAAKTEKK